MGFIQSGSIPLTQPPRIADTEIQDVGTYAKIETFGFK